MSLLEITDLVKIYNKPIKALKSSSEVNVLKGINFSIENQDFVAIMGRSGCGKTTLLKLLGTIDQPTSGSILFNGKDIKKLNENELSSVRRNNIGFVFQDFNLMDSLNIRENIMLPMILEGKKTNHMLELVEKNAKQFDIDKLLDKYPYELSGGEKQRVAICRSLSNEPDLILADEPTGNLDSLSCKIVVECLKKINQDLLKTVVVVTHDPLIAKHFKKVIFLKDGNILDVYYNTDGEDKFYERILDKMICL